MVDHVEGFGKVNRHGQCTVWWSGLVKARGHSVCKGKECCCCVVSCSEAVLGVGNREGIKLGEEQTFKDFNCR